MLFRNHAFRFSVVRSKWGRWITLAAVGLLALAGAVTMGQGDSSAADGFQTSPLTSPVETPTSTPTPTPTPTSPIPPTLTPPSDLEAWPTPTPTPYPDPVEAALALVMEKEEVERSELQVVTRLTAIDPNDDSEFTAVQIRNAKTSQWLWLRGDPDGKAAFLPDFTEAALQQVAEETNAKLDDLNLSSSGYAPYPFLSQVIWTGAVFNADTGKQSFLAFDLAGEPVDLTELSDLENAAKAETCGVVEPRFCPELLLAAPDEPINARAVLTGTEALTDTLAFMEDEAAPYETEDLNIFFVAPRDVILNLAHQAGVEAIREHFPDEVLPLDTNLILGLSEDEEQIWLTLESQKNYPLSAYRVEAALERIQVTSTQKITLATVIEGIFTPASGPASSRPALGKLPLGDITGAYNLVVRYTNNGQDLDLEDHYLLIVSERRIVMRPSENHFTWPRYVTWLRLPEDAIWFVVHAREKDADGQPYEIDADAFAEKTLAFYDAVAELGAEPLTLTEGVYVNQGFIPPWTTWQIPDGDQVRIPLTPEKSLRLRLPAIRYFEYRGDLSPVEEVITAFCQDEMAIEAYTTAGDALETCTAE